MKALLQVALGGAIGAGLRFGISLWLKPLSIDAFPTHTFIINIAGCLLIGVCAAWLLKVQHQEILQLFIISGVLGGFTTFSSFSLETMYLLKAEKYNIAMLYILLSTVLGIGASFLGFLIPKWLS